MATVCSLLPGPKLILLLGLLPGSHENLLILITSSACVCGSGCPSTSQELAGSITGGLGKGPEFFGGLCGDARLLNGGDAISVNPAVRGDSEDAPQTNRYWGKVHSDSSQQVGKAEHVGVRGPEGAISRDHAMNVKDEKTQSNDWVVPQGKDPANQVDEGNWDPKQAHQSEIENVRVVMGLGNLDQKPPVVLQRVPLLADTLVKHG